MLNADVTSYLSATAYADRSFANRVVGMVLWAPTRLVTSAPKLNLARVAYHSRAALSRDLRFQFLLSAAPAVSPLLVSLGPLLLSRGVPLLLGAGHFVLAYLSAGVAAAWLGGRRSRWWLNSRWWLSVSPLALVLLLVRLEGIWPVVTVLFGAGALVVVVVAWHRCWSRYRLSAPLLQGRRPRPPVRKAVESRLEEIHALERGNVVVFAESDQHQLVDCGEPIGYRGSFTLRLTERRDPEREIKDFEVVELVDALKAAVPTIDLEEQHWAEDRVYVGDATLLFDPSWRDPKTGLLKMLLEGPELEARMRCPEPFARHYLCIRVAAPPWQGHLAFTVAVHFHKTRTGLTIESNKFVYRPVRPEYREIDQVLTTPRRRDVRSVLWQAFCNTPKLMNGALEALREDLCLLAHELWRGSALRFRHPYVKLRSVDGRAFDLRAEVGGRWPIDVDGQATEFQAADIERYQDVIEESLLHALQEFLDDHNIDTRALTEESTQIFNNYQIVATGNQGPIAVGTKATASATTPETTAETDSAGAEAGAPA
jgi:hypothetical protein